MYYCSIPWIPIENYDNFEASQKNLKADIWAYATTLWEIFSRGEQLKIPNAMEHFLSGDRPSKPHECYSINGMHEIMLVGWNADPEKRFSPQNIFSTLLSASKCLLIMVFLRDKRILNIIFILRNNIIKNLHRTNT